MRSRWLVCSLNTLILINHPDSTTRVHLNPWNVGKRVPVYTTHQPRRQQSSYSPPKNRKSRSFTSLPHQYLVNPTVLDSVQSTNYDGPHCVVFSIRCDNCTYTYTGISRTDLRCTPLASLTITADYYRNRNCKLAPQRKHSPWSAAVRTCASIQHCTYDSTNYYLASCCSFQHSFLGDVINNC
jgi:hypothetical protein